MTTTLNERGQIGIPKPIRDSDQLRAGDAFSLVRLTPGHYLLSKRQKSAGRFTVAAGPDGLPLIRVASGVITSEQVKDLESQTP